MSNSRNTNNIWCPASAHGSLTVTTACLLGGRPFSCGYFAMQTVLDVELDAGIDYSRDQSVQDYVKIII